jgi:hypothetical protein
MLSKELQTIVENATVRLTKEGGLGVLVCDNLIITAAHCIPCRCDGRMDDIYANPENPFEFIVEIEANNGEKFQVEPLAVEPVFDIAILLPLTHDDLCDEYFRFVDFCDRTKSVPVSLSDNVRGDEFPVYIYTHKETWMTGSVKINVSYQPIVTVVSSQMFELGQSGGPVVNESGELVCIISHGGGYEESCPRPSMTLPVWIYRRYFKKEPWITDEMRRQIKERTRNIISDMEKKKNQGTQN